MRIRLGGVFNCSPGASKIVVSCDLGGIRRRFGSVVVRPCGVSLHRSVIMFEDFKGFEIAARRGAAVNIFGNR